MDSNSKYVARVKRAIGKRQGTAFFVATEAATHKANRPNIGRKRMRPFVHPFLRQGRQREEEIARELERRVAEL